MWDFSRSAPSWSDYKDLISELVLEEGMTTVGSFAFYGLDRMDGDIVIPDSVEEIGHSAFYKNLMVSPVGYAALRPATLTIGRNVMIFGETTPADYPDGMLASGRTLSRVQELW